MISAVQNRAIVRASAIYDLVVTIGFVTPWTALLSLDMIFAAGRLFGLSAAAPAFDPLHMLFVNMMGSVVVVWSLVRIINATQILGRFDALARGLFTVWQLWAVARGGPTIILAFTVLEVAFGIAQLLPVRVEQSPGSAQS
jgi:hypothetical protein